MFTFKLKKSSKKTQAELIQEVHTSFYTEVDRLLEEAKITHSLDTNLSDLITKRNRLKSLGFTNTKECTDAEKEISRLNTLKEENNNKKELIEAINYFSFKYPQYKFITEDSVKSICFKYGLIYGEVSKYIGTVPDKNLKHIEEFKISDEDKAYYNITTHPLIYNIRPDKRLVFYPKRYFEDRKKLVDGTFEPIYTKNSSLYDNRYSCKEAPLEIAATIKDFDTKNMRIENHKLVEDPIDKDPVVLQPVMFNDKKYYLIVTAWGDEASDELIINQKMN